MRVHERFAELLQQSGLRQAELARRIGEDRDWINNRVRGRTAIAADDIPRLARAMAVSPCAFFEEDPHRERRVADVPASYAPAAVGRMAPDSVRGMAGVPEAEVQLIVDFLKFRREREGASARD